MEVEAVVSDDGRTVDLNIVPSSTEFEGFIDYGQDFSSYTVGQVLAGVAAFNTVDYFPVDNPVLQPVFRSSKVTTSVTVWDSNTVVLGALMTEKSQKIKDKVPIVGNIPIVGRAFQSQLAQREMKNVIFFVTVNVVDPGGNRVNQPVLNPTAAAAQ
jgi:general secretion pathway protein D